MKILLFGKPISTNKVRKLGFQLVDVAGSVERHHAQSAQARAHPEDKTERDQADRASKRALESMAKLKAMITEAQGGP